jgi:MFS family permease
MTDSSAVPAGAMSARYRPLTLGVLAIITCAAFEAMAVVTAMPAVAAELSGEAAYGLAFSMYLTASLLGTVLAGSWTDARGPRPALAVGMLLMIAGLILSGAAPAFWVVTAGRAVSGLGGGFVIVAVYVIIGRVFPAQAQPVVFGWLSAAWVVPSLVGPLVAGVVAEQASWRWVFLGVAPVVLAAVLIVWPRTRGLGPPEPAAAKAGRDRSAAAAHCGGPEAPGDSRSGGPRPRRPGAGTGWHRAVRGLGLAGGRFRRPGGAQRPRHAGTGRRRAGG